MTLTASFLQEPTGKPQPKKIEPEPVKVEETTPATEQSSHLATVYSVKSDQFEELLEIRVDENRLTVNGVPYTQGEVDLIKEADAAGVIAQIHLIKEVFGGTVGEQQESVYNPISCNYKGEERPVHPAVCRWHAERNDEFCQACFRFASLRKEMGYGSVKVAG